MLKRLRESTFGKFVKIAESRAGIGTPLAEYSELGPFHCNDCIFITKRSADGVRALCKEKHMMKDPKTKKSKNGQAIVNLKTGCCRFVKPPKGSK